MKTQDTVLTCKFLMIACNGMEHKMIQKYKNYHNQEIPLDIDILPSRSKLMASTSLTFTPPPTVSI